MKRLYVQNEKQWEKVCNKKYYSDRDLQVLEIDNGIVLPSKETEKPGIYRGGVSDEDGNFIAGLLRNCEEPQKNHLYYCLNSSYFVPKTELTYVNEIVIFGGALIGHFGHFILEGMGRLWYLLQNETVTMKIVFTSILEKKEWFDDFFRLLGIKKDSIYFIDKPTQFKKIIIPEESVHSWDSYMKEYLFPYRKILENVLPSTHKKVYLTRTEFEQGGALCCNEKYFESYFRKKGFLILAPEQYTIDEQIGILSGAEEIVTTLGSLSHFAMFCKKKTRFTILTRVDDDVLPAQCLVNEASEVEWFIVDVSLNFLFATRVYGVNQIGVTKYWRVYIKDMYEENIEYDTIQDSCYEYLVKWCKFYSNPHQYKKIANRDFFELFSRMYKILCGSELDKKKYHIDMNKTELQNKMKQYETYFNRLEEDKIEYVRMQSSLELYQKAFGLLQNLKGGIFAFRFKLKQKQIMESTFEKINQELKRPVLLYEVHLSFEGWTRREVEGAVCGDTIQHLHIEAIKIKFDNPEYHIYYSTCAKIDEWNTEIMDGQVSGTVGRSIPLRGIRIRLDDKMINEYSIWYRIYKSDNIWSEWKCDNEENCVSNDKVIEGIQIKIIRK